MHLGRIRLLLTIACASALAACGGGGSEHTMATVSTASFALHAAYFDHVSKGQTVNFTVSGTCDGTASMTDSAPSATTFEGANAVATTETLTVSLTNCTPSSLTATSTTYFDSSYLPLGEVTASAEFGVCLTPATALPESVKVGDTGSFATLTEYTDSSKTVVSGTSVVSYVVEADTASTAVVNLVTRSYDASNALLTTQQSRYRIDSSGVLTLLSIDAQASGGSTTHLVLTRT
jgi:hypothetical protein